MSNAHLETLFELLRFPSISTHSEHVDDMKNCGDWLVAQLQKAGLEAARHATAGHPCVIGRSPHREGLPTVMIYGHYDVQPVDPLELWDHDPLQPVIKDGRIIARGSTDNKGQHLAHILGVAEAMKRDGELPVNVIFLIEGEEEIGSPNLEPFLLKNADLLKCDVCAVSDTGMIAPGMPTFTYGLRGIACMELKIRGPIGDLHSGIYGGTVANPALVAAQLAASLHRPDGSVAIDGFYDSVSPLHAWERAAWADLPYGGEVIQNLTGVPSLFGESGYTALERTWGRPTAEVNGIGGGYQGEGSKTVIPAEALLKLSFRLVPDQDPQDILAKAKAHFESHAPEGVHVEIINGHAGNAYLMDPQSGFGKCAQRALQKTFSKEPALIREGGSIPIIDTFKQVLGIDTIMLGLALPDCNAHAPNENFPVENFEAGIQLNQHLLREIAKG